MDVVGTALGGAANVKSVLLTEATVNFTPVEVFNFTDEVRTIKITSVIADDSVVSRVPLPIRQVDINEVKPIFNVRAIKRGSTVSIIDEPNVIFLITFDDSMYAKFTNIDHMVAYEPSLILHRIEVVFSMLQEYCSSMISKVETYDSTIAETPVKCVDLSKLGERNMNKIAEGLFLESEISTAEMMNKRTYVRKRAMALPFTFPDQLAVPDSERQQYYHTFTVPYHPFELMLYQLASNLLIAQYCHPTIVLQYLQERAPPFLMVDSAISTKLLCAGSGVIMPRPVMELLDYELVYLSPLATWKLSTRLAGKISIKIALRIVTEVQTSVQEVTAVSSNVNSLTTSNLVHMTPTGTETIVQFIARSVLNPNFAIAKINALTSDCFDNFIYGCCLLSLQAVLPPSAILASDRVAINNRLALFIMKYIARAPTVNRLVNQNIIPSLNDLNSWQNDRTDRLATIYRNILPGEGEVLNILQLYYRGNNPNEVSQILIPANETSTLVDETMSISLPYLYGSPINNMRRDDRLSQFKRSLQLPDRSPILIAAVEANNVIDMSNVNSKGDIIRAIYLGAFSTTPALWIRNASSNTAFITKLLDSLQNLEAIFESVLANTYSNAINIYCDSVYHADIPLNWKLMETINPSDFLFSIFGLVPQYQILTESVPDFFQGAEDILILQLTRTAYQCIRNKLGAEPTDMFHLKDVQVVVSKIVSVLINKEVDIRNYFTDSPKSKVFSKPMWDRFMRRPVEGVLPRLYQIVMDQVDRVYAMMSQLDPYLPIVDSFYLVRTSGFVNRGSSETILAASSFFEKQLLVISTIGSFEEAVRLHQSQFRVDNTCYSNRLASMFNKLVAVSPNEIAYSGDDGKSFFRPGLVQCIKVNMRAKYKLKLINEDGKFSDGAEIEKSKFDEFMNFLYKHRSDPYPPIFEIPITIGLNDIGETTSTAMRRNTMSIDDYFMRYTGSQVIVPIDRVYLRQVDSFDNLRNEFQGDVTIRDTPFDIWSEIQVSYVPIGVHGVLLEPNPQP